MKAKKVVALALLAILLLSAFACGGGGSSGLPPYEVTSFSVEAIYAQDITFTTYDEGVIEGYFTISGGERDIYFSIRDPYGYIVFGPRLVTDHGEFRVRCAYAGNYTLTFDNGLSLYDRYIVLHYRGYPE